MAFRYDGTAWDGQKWQTVPAITQLGKQIEAVRPGIYATDGTVASRRHDEVSPTSDHSPDEAGDVRAIDFGGDKEFLAEVTEALRKSADPRIKYVIHNERIFSSYPKPGYPPYIWRPYTGANGHITHAHVSSLRGHDEDASEWSISEQEQVVAEPLKPYEEAAIARCEEDGVFTEWSTDEEGEIDEFVPIRTLAVFFDRILDYVDAMPTGADGEDGKDGIVEIYIDGERVE